MAIPLADLRELYRHMEWADATVWRAVLSHPAAAADTRLRDLLLHLHAVQRAFLNIWMGERIEWRTADDFPDVAAVQAWAHPAYDRAYGFLDSPDAADTSRPILLPWAAQLTQQFGREPHHPTLADTIFQVTSHSTYHRGQINARLREVGGEPPLVDFIAWVWFGKPDPAWQEAA
jgi:uncharacterized damage-inducible protein DinB